MFKEIEIGGKQVAFLANGATPLFYKQFFKKDLLKLMSEGEGLEVATENIPELGFIMAKQADKADMMRLTQAQYVEWLSLFEPLDLTLKGDEIVGVYVGNSIPMEKPKKKGKGKANA